MFNFATAEKINSFSKKALARIEKDELLPTPQAYEILYVYYAADNSDITRTIDILDRKGTKLTQEICADIHRQFLSKDDANQKIEAAGAQIHQTIGDVTSVVDGVQKATGNYGTNMSALSEKLTPDMSPDEVERIVSSIKDGTNNMMTKNVALEHELSRTAKIMAELRHDLEEVRKEANTDALTGLSNRKSFDKKLGNVHEDSKETKKPFSLLLLDIDHFKNFNDSFGHLVGDQVLRLVARTLKNGVKGRDIPCRYGGEEFAIILPDTEAGNAKKIADQLREAISNKDIVNRSTGAKLTRVTFSAGVAEFNGDETVDDIVGRADRAL